MSITLLLLLTYANAAAIYKLGGEATAKSPDPALLFEQARESALEQAARLCPGGYQVLTQSPTPPPGGFAERLVAGSGGKFTAYFDLTLTECK